MTESRESRSVLKRWKIILDVPGKENVPDDAFKKITEPALVFVGDVTTIEELVHDEDDEEVDTQESSKKQKRDYGGQEEAESDDDEMLITE